MAAVKLFRFRSSDKLENLFRLYYLQQTAARLPLDVRERDCPTDPTGVVLVSQQGQGTQSRGIVLQSQSELFFICLYDFHFTFYRHNNFQKFVLGLGAIQRNWGIQVISGPLNGCAAVAFCWSSRLKSYLISIYYTIFRVFSTNKIGQKDTKLEKNHLF